MSIWGQLTKGTKLYAKDLICQLEALEVRARVSENADIDSKLTLLAAISDVSLGCTSAGQRRCRPARHRIKPGVRVLTVQNFPFRELTPVSPSGRGISGVTEDGEGMGEVVERAPITSGQETLESQWICIQ